MSDWAWFGCVAFASFAIGWVGHIVVSRDDCDRARVEGYATGYEHRKAGKPSVLGWKCQIHAAAKGYV